jgi:DNA-binding response OmpR family regulator
MGPKVAVIEDDPDIAELLRQVLGSEGFQVTLIRNGAQALPVLETSRFDAAILDVMLPGKDGITVMREIRENPLTEKLPVVMLSAKVDEQTMWSGWRAGCDLYLSKPFDSEKLVQAMRKVMA